MASGGWLGKMIIGPLFSSLLGGGSKSVKASDSTYPSVTARDLVSSTSSLTPSSPVMGSDSDQSDDSVVSKKKRGISSLYVDNNTGGTGDYTGRGGL